MQGIQLSSLSPEQYSVSIAKVLATWLQITVEAEDVYFVVDNTPLMNVPNLKQLRNISYSSALTAMVTMLPNMPSIHEEESNCNLLFHQ